MTFVVDIVTGASQAIGRAIAECVAFHRSLELSKSSIPPPYSDHYSLIMVGRDVDRGTKAAEAIQADIAVFFEACDLSNYSDVLDLKDRINERVPTEGKKEFKVGILVNDAAECPRMQEFVPRPQMMEDRKTKTVKIDKQFASNVLGYHFMIKAFQNNFSSEVDSFCTRQTHIVNVASNWAGDLDLNDLHFQQRPYDNDTAYRQSKQCDRMLNKIWSEKLKDVAVVNSCHPGDPCTTLSKALGYNLWSSAPSRNMIESQTPISFLCGFGNTVRVTGGWFDSGRGENPSRCRFAHLTKDANRLFDVCESFAQSQ